MKKLLFAGLVLCSLSVSQVNGMFPFDDLDLKMRAEERRNLRTNATLDLITIDNYQNLFELSPEQLNCVTTLDCSSKHIDELGLSRISHLFRQMTSLRVFDLAECQLNTHAMLQLAQICLNTPSITSLSLENCNISYHEIQNILVPSLQQTPNLKNLNLAGNGTVEERYGTFESLRKSALHRNLPNCDIYFGQDYGKEGLEYNY